MSKFVKSALVAAGAAGAYLLYLAATIPAAADVASPMLSHDVYFSLKESTPTARKKLVDACKKYLTKHPGAVFFGAGTVAESLDRPVNDRDFDVALHIVFKDLAAHDKYQSAERHKQFIEEN